MRNPLPFMADLEAQGVHVAVSAENCLTLMLPAPNGTQHAIEDFDHNTGVLFVSVAALSVRPPMSVNQSISYTFPACC